MMAFILSKSHLGVIKHTHCGAQPPSLVFRALPSPSAEIEYMVNCNPSPHWPLAAIVLLSVSVDPTVHDASNKPGHSVRKMSSRPIHTIIYVRI